MESTGLGVWPGLDDTVRSHGDRRLAGVEAGGVQGRSGSIITVRGPAVPQRRMVLDLLRHAPDRLGCCRDWPPLVGDSGHDGGVLSPLEACWLDFGAIPGLGYVRERAQLHHLATECRRIRGAIDVRATDLRLSRNGHLASNFFWDL